MPTDGRQQKSLLGWLVPKRPLEPSDNAPKPIVPHKSGMEPVVTIYTSTKENTPRPSLNELRPIAPAPVKKDQAVVKRVKTVNAELAPVALSITIPDTAFIANHAILISPTDGQNEEGSGNDRLALPMNEFLEWCELDCFMAQFSDVIFDSSGEPPLTTEDWMSVLDGSNLALLSQIHQALLEPLLPSDKKFTLTHANLCEKAKKYFNFINESEIADWFRGPLTALTRRQHLTALSALMHDLLATDECRQQIAEWIEVGKSIAASKSELKSRQTELQFQIKDVEMAVRLNEGERRTLTNQLAHLQSNPDADFEDAERQLSDAKAEHERLVNQKTELETTLRDLMPDYERRLMRANGALRGMCSTERDGMREYTLIRCGNDVLYLLDGAALIHRDGQFYSIDMEDALRFAPRGYAELLDMEKTAAVEFSSEHTMASRWNVNVEDYNEAIADEQADRSKKTNKKKPARTATKKTSKRQRDSDEEDESNNVAPRRSLRDRQAAVRYREDDDSDAVSAKRVVRGQRRSARHQQDGHSDSSSDEREVRGQRRSARHQQDGVIVKVWCDASSDCSPDRAHRSSRQSARLRKQDDAAKDTGSDDGHGDESDTPVNPTRRSVIVDSD